MINMARELVFKLGKETAIDDNADPEDESIGELNFSMF